MLDPWYALLAAIVVLLIVAALSKNRIVRAENEVAYGLGQVHTQLQRRHDLIPNLVAAAKMHAAHELQVIETIASAHKAAISSTMGTAARFEAEDKLGRGLQVFQNNAMNYPDLRANSAFGKLMNELAEIEVCIQRSRLYYNDKVRLYLDLIRQIPGCWLSPGGQPIPPFFVSDSEARVAPVVQ